MTVYRKQSRKNKSLSMRFKKSQVVIIVFIFLVYVMVISIFRTKENTTTPTTDLKTKIEDINRAQAIINYEDFKISNETFVVLIQVHKRIAYLEQLIISLRSVKDVNSALLIFSHDYYSEDINLLVKSIDFAPVLQIFFPFSLQLNPNTFPGNGSNDCPWNLDVNEAKARQCEGADNPDSYGHFRQGHVCQIKHHWWWKVNRVFEHLDVTRYFDGYVLFLEEDHYLVPDALHMLRLMTNTAPSICSECNSYHLGIYKSSLAYKNQADKVDMAPWDNLGYCFNRSLWRTLKACSNVFCSFDDYNWDWSYLFSAQECFSEKLIPLVVRVSRIFHIGDCGIHHSGKECEMSKSLDRAKEAVESMKPFLFPKSIQLQSISFNQPGVNKGWGGWSDQRDIQLCLDISEH